MKLSIKNSIYQAIIHNKWLDISYTNKEDITSYYYIGIKDIDIEKGRIDCDIFNKNKSSEVFLNGRNTFIYVDRINNATVLEHSYYDTPGALLEKIIKDKRFRDYLEVVNFDNNILRYLSDCYRLDNDPYLKEEVMINGVDIHTLTSTGKYKLDDKQFEALLDNVFRKPKNEAERINRFQTLAINKFSIDINDKQYVVAYRTLTLNFKNKTLKMSDKTSINKSFLIDGKKVSLGMYLDMNPDDFCANYDQYENEYIEAIKQHRADFIRPFCFPSNNRSLLKCDRKYEKKPSQFS